MFCFQFLRVKPALEALLDGIGENKDKIFTSQNLTTALSDQCGTSDQRKSFDTTIFKSTCEITSYFYRTSRG